VDLDAHAGKLPSESVLETQVVAICRWIELELERR
jgi:hypothetical protein